MVEYAERVKGMKASEIREILKYAQDPKMISFGGGMPSPHSFPVKIVKKIADDILKKHGAQALQYGPTDGIKQLKESLIKRMKKKGVKCNEDEILITTGSQQALDLVPKILINPGDFIVVECPSYIGALVAFRAYQPNFISISMDDHGMNTYELEEKIKEHKGKPIKFIYTIPTFQNPSGVTMSLERRKHLLEIAKKYNILIFEDDAYSELIFSGKPLHSLKSLDKDDNVIYTSTFSKVLSPGFRLGWAIANKDIIRKMAIAKQGTDLSSNVFVQYIADEYLRSGSINKHIPKIKRMYKRKRNIMLRALKKHFPEGCKWTKPDGGMFIWVTLPSHLNTKEMFKDALKEKVLFVHGAAFCVDGTGHNKMRLNFSNTDDDKIEIGIKRLAKIIIKKMK